MLTHLRIQNIAVAENIELELHPGFNIITGETGAGKSIILKSIELLAGKKASPGIVRTGTEKAIIEGFFNLAPELIEFIKNEIDELSHLVTDTELLIKRIIDTSGRSKFYINGSLATSGVISHISKFLFNITGQHDQQNLKDSSYQRDLLDNFGTPQDLLEKIRKLYKEYSEKLKLLNNLEKSKEELIFKIEKLNFQKKELSDLKLKSGEKEALEQELDKAKHLDKIKSSLEEVLFLLDNRGQSKKSVDLIKANAISAYSAVSKTCDVLSQLSSFDSELDNSYKTALQAMHCFNELLSQTDYIYSKLNFDSSDFDNKQSRLTEIKQIERKYRKEAHELISFLEQVKTELSELEGSTFDEKKLQEEVNALRNSLNEAEKDLTKIRKSSAIKMEKLVLNNLKEVNLERARFEINILPKESSSQGADEIIFNFSANPGETLQPLNKVASGGELSRIQLVLNSLDTDLKTNKQKTNLASQGILQVFDEIDTGVSGAVSQSIGEKLLKISKKNQLIAITHSAQVAALADNHILIKKEVLGTRTFSNVSNLNDDLRVKTIAAMLAGKEVSKDFMKSAEKLLEIRNKK